MDTPPVQQWVTLSRDTLDEIERLAMAATRDEWKLGHTGTETVDAAAAWMGTTIRKRDAGDLWLCFIGDPDAEDGTICPAYTGNGSTSEANARYLVAVQPRQIMTLLLFLRHMLGDKASVAIPLPPEIKPGQWPDGVPAT